MDDGCHFEELAFMPATHSGGSSWESFWGCPKGIPSSTPHRYVQITWRPGCYSGALWGTPKNDPQNESPLCVAGMCASVGIGLDQDDLRPVL